MLLRGTQGPHRLPNLTGRRVVICELALCFVSAHLSNRHHHLPVNACGLTGNAHDWDSAVSRFSYARRKPTT